MLSLAFCLMNGISVNLPSNLFGL